MKNKIMKIVGTTALSLSLIAGVAGAVSADADAVASKEGREAIVITPYAVQNSILNWDFLNNTAPNPTNHWTVEIGYPYINMYVKNTGSQSFRVEVRHDQKGTIIFNKDIPADGLGHNFINNDNNPLVPSGTYTLTIYSGTATAKGTITMKASNTPWQQ